MKMQDKEFDQAFNSKFNDFEVEPSPMVWEGIADELDGKRSKSSLAAYLSIAASVIVLLAASALFFKQQEKPTKHQADPNKLAANFSEPATTVSPKSVTEPATGSSTKRIVSTAKYATTPSAPAAINAGRPSTEKAENTPGDAESIKRDNPQLIAAAAAPPRELLQPVVPGKEVDLAIKSPEMDQQVAVVHPAIIASVIKPDVAPAKKRGIHSLGGLINVLVAKVDKRQDKLIEFTEDDDDDTESKVTGVNLGIIKIKKQ